jgi:hypothetical protein
MSEIKQRRIILKYALKTWYVRVWIGLSWLRIGNGAGCFEHGNELQQK